MLEIIIAAVVAVLAGGGCYKLLAMQEAAAVEWLKYAVTLAEKELGSGTGQLKLRYVYNLFVEKFALLAKVISFDTFSGYVDVALDWLKGQLESNAAVSELVNGAEGD